MQVDHLLSQIGVEDKRKLVMMYREKERIEEENKLWRMKPNKGQSCFMASNKKIRAFIAANKVGKTASAAVIVLRYVLERGRVAKVIGSLGWDAGVRDVIWPEIQKWCPKGSIIETRTGSKGVISQLKLKAKDGNVSTIKFMSGDQDPMSFEGDLCDIAWIDEPCKRDIYAATLRALLISNGPMIFTLTPLEEPWVYNDIFLASERDSNIGVYQASMYDATIENGGHLTVKQVEEYESQLPVDERGPRVYGEFRHLVGRVFKEYDEVLHVVRPFTVPRNWDVLCGIDLHQQKPHGVIWVAFPRDSKDIYVINEVYYKCGLEDLAKEIKRVSSFYNVVRFVIDSSAEVMDWNRRHTARSLLRDYGVPTVLARKYNNKETARFMIQDALIHKRLKIFKSCVRTRFEFVNYIWDKDIEGKVKKVNDDLLDPLQYVIIEKLGSVNLEKLHV